MNDYKKLAGQTIIYGLGTIIPRLLNYLLLTPFYTRIFLQNEYGVIVELYAYIAFLLVLLTHGMETTYFRFSTLHDDNKKVFNNALGSILLISVIFITAVFCLKNQIASLIGYSNNVEFIKWFSLIVVFDAITAVPFAKLRNENKALKFALIKIINIVINIGFNIFFFVICKNTQNQLLQTFYNPNIGVGYAFLSNLLASGFTFILLYKEFLTFKINFDFTLLKKMYQYAWPLLIIGLVGMFNEYADKIILKYLSVNPDSMKDVGIYGANYKLAVLMSIFIQMFKYAAEPFFFKKSEDTDAKKVYANIMNYFIIFCLFIFLLVTLYIDLFKYFIGANFREGLFIVPIILFANMFLGIFYNLSVWYKLTNKTLNGAIIAIIGVLVTLILNILLIPKVGYLGSAWAHFFCYLIMIIVSYLWGRKIYKINYPLKKIGIYTLISVIIYVLYNKLTNEVVITNLFTATLLILVFIFAVIKIEKIKLSQIKRIIKK